MTGQAVVINGVSRYITCSTTASGPRLPSIPWARLQFTCLFGEPLAKPSRTKQTLARSPTWPGTTVALSPQMPILPISANMHDSVRYGLATLTLYRLPMVSIHDRRTGRLRNHSVRLARPYLAERYPSAILPSVHLRQQRDCGLVTCSSQVQYPHGSAHLI